MRYDKLVRDKIPDIIRQKGRIPITHVADEKEYWIKLKQKLQEEVTEFLESEAIEEIADILEVIETIEAVKNVTKQEIQSMQSKKRDDRGGFVKKIILEES